MTKTELVYTARDLLEGVFCDGCNGCVSECENYENRVKSVDQALTELRGLMPAKMEAPDYNKLPSSDKKGIEGMIEGYNDCLSQVMEVLK